MCTWNQLSSSARILHVTGMSICDRTIVAESGGGAYVIFDSPCQTWKTSCLTP
jgi:hypothetical protein